MGGFQNRFNANFSIQIQVDSSDSNLEYVGKAQTGAPTSNPVWQIKRLDCTTGTTILYAGGEDKFNNIWDDRESLSYS